MTRYGDHTMDPNFSMPTTPTMPAEPATPRTMCAAPCPNDKNGPCPAYPDRPRPCFCVEPLQHHGEHGCRCDETWPNKADRDLLDRIERATVVTPQPGDILVFEVPQLSMCEFDELMTTLQAVCPEGVRPIVLAGGQFRGVVRRPPRMVDASTFADVAAGRKVYLPGERDLTVKPCRNCDGDLCQRPGETAWWHLVAPHCGRPEPQP